MVSDGLGLTDGAEGGEFVRDSWRTDIGISEALSSSQSSSRATGMVDGGVVDSRIVNMSNDNQGEPSGVRVITDEGDFAMVADSNHDRHMLYH